MANLYVAPNATLVLRSADWVAFITDAENRMISPGARLLVLPDSATPAEMLAAWSTSPPPLPPTA